MRILMNHKIAYAVAKCHPHEIAVAFIGSDWRAFVPNTKILEAVIVSPTVGSNPRAILKLEKAIGWDRLFFLDELHAKIYIGKRSAVVGSANLTKNGLSGHSLIELCVEIKGEKNLNRLEKIFSGLIRQAKNQYPSIASKKTRLQELEGAWNAAISAGIIKSGRNSPDHFMDFELIAADQFYVSWYQLGNPKYSDEVRAVQSKISDDLHFAKSDNVKKHKWALVWRINDKSKPHKTEVPYWFYIHDVFPNGVVDKGYEYPKCAIQRNDLAVPHPPFRITRQVADAFKKSVIQPGVADYLIQEDREVFNLRHSIKGVPELIKKMKDILANKKIQSRKPKRPH